MMSVAITLRQVAGRSLLTSREKAEVGYYNSEEIACKSSLYTVVSSPQDLDSGLDKSGVVELARGNGCIVHGLGCYLIKSVRRG